MANTIEENSLDEPEAIVFAGNLHVLQHAKAALEHSGVPAAKSVLILKAAKNRIRSKLYNEAIRDQWHLIITLRTREDWLPKESTMLASFAGTILERPILRVIFELVRIRHDIKSCLRDLEGVGRVRLVVGGIYASPLERTVSNAISHEEFMLVDDGNMTIGTTKNRKAEAHSGFSGALDQNNHKAGSSLARRLKNSLLRRLCGVDDRGEASIHFFTSHQVSSIEGDRVTPVYRSTASFQVEEDVAHVIGMPVVTRNICSQHTYRCFLRQAAKLARGRRIIYFPHPAEQEADFQVVAGTVPELEISSYSRGYEAGIFETKRYPGQVFVCYSSVIANLASMELPGLAIFVCKIEEAQICDRSRRKTVAMIYESVARCPSVRFFRPAEP